MSNLTQETSAYDLADLRVEVAIGKLAGATDKAIALLHDVRPHHVRAACRYILRNGLVPPERIAGWRYGKPSGRRTPDEEYNAAWLRRIRSRVVVDANGCWIWQGPKATRGYGLDMYRLKSCTVHRQMYKLVHNVELRPDQHVCHACDVKLCCNPDHLWIGTAHENQMDSAIKKRHRNARKTHCKRGHPLSGDNLYLSKENIRHCLACSRARQQAKKLKAAA